MYYSFEELEVWKRSTLLAIELTKALRKSNDYAFKNQLIRSVLSIPSNIAEGSERQSDSEFRYFLNVAKGSSAELRTQLLIAMKTEILEEELAKEMIEECRQVSSMLHGLIKSIDNRNKPLP